MQFCHTRVDEFLLERTLLLLCCDTPALPLLNPVPVTLATEQHHHHGHGSRLQQRWSLNCLIQSIKTWRSGDERRWVDLNVLAFFCWRRGLNTNWTSRFVVRYKQVRNQHGETRTVILCLCWLSTANSNIHIDCHVPLDMNYDPLMISSFF